MKKLLKIFIGIAAVIVVAVSVVFYFTSDMAKTAESFFAAIKEKDYVTAYQYLSEDFRSSTPQTEFVSFLEKGALLQFKEASWSNRSISGGRGELDGSITTESGGVVPVKLGFVKENGKWLIYSIHKPQAGIVGGEPDRLPDESVLVALVRESMRKFALSVSARDFSGFHQAISHLWQRQITVDGLNEVFKTFWENDINLLPLENYSPVFNGDPSLNEDGVLLIKGYYPTQPSKVLFELKYIYEGVSWKLIGTNVNVVPAG